MSGVILMVNWKHPDSGTELQSCTWNQSFNCALLFSNEKVLLNFQTGLTGSGLSPWQTVQVSRDALWGRRVTFEGFLGVSEKRPVFGGHLAPQLLKLSFFILFSELGWKCWLVSLSHWPALHLWGVQLQNVLFNSRLLYSLMSCVSGISNQYWKASSGEVK